MELEKSSSEINDNLIEVFKQLRSLPTRCSNEAFMWRFRDFYEGEVGGWFGLFVPTIASFPHFQIPGCLSGLGFVISVIPLVDTSVRHAFAREHLGLKVKVEKVADVFYHNRVGLMSGNRN